jgi:hypothetical protein
MNTKIDQFCGQSPNTDTPLNIHPQGSRSSPLGFPFLIRSTVTNLKTIERELIDINRISVHPFMSAHPDERPFDLHYILHQCRECPTLAVTRSQTATIEIKTITSFNASQDTSQIGTDRANRR